MVFHSEHLHRLLPSDDHAPGSPPLVVRLHPGGSGPLVPAVVPVPVPWASGHRHREPQEPGESREEEAQQEWKPAGQDTSIGVSWGHLRKDQGRGAQEEEEEDEAQG